MMPGKLPVPQCCEFDAEALWFPAGSITERVYQADATVLPGGFSNLSVLLYRVPPKPANSLLVFSQSA
eukprot:963188-Amphidinium_carterae.2